MGLKGSTVLHQDDGGEYIWAPLLVDPDDYQIIVKDYLIIGLYPKCKLLKPSQAKVTVLADKSIQIDMAASIYGTDRDATLFMTYNRFSNVNAWNTTTLRFNCSHGQYHWETTAGLHCQLPRVRDESRGGHWQRPHFQPADQHNERHDHACLSSVCPWVQDCDATILHLAPYRR